MYTDPSGHMGDGAALAAAEAGRDIENYDSPGGWTLSNSGDVETESAGGTYVGYQNGYDVQNNSVNLNYQYYPSGVTDIRIKINRTNEYDNRTLGQMTVTNSTTNYLTTITSRILAG
jgi:hypothetical protein